MRLLSILLLSLSACASAPPVKTQQHIVTAPTRGQELIASDIPSPEDCRAAVRNILRVYGSAAEIPPSMISTCVEHASAQSVRCMLRAQTDDDVVACEAR